MSDLEPGISVRKISLVASHNPFQSLAFRYPLRKYQRMILSQIEAGQEDHQYHIVAPPGAGKTIIGLELIRRLGLSTGAGAVIFAPTATIQEQWREKVRMFLPAAGAGNTVALDALVSLDPQHLAPINVFTYQLISTPGEARERVQEMARHRWVGDLLEEGQVHTESAAWTRLATLEQNNPRSYQRELSRRYRHIKHNLLRAGHIDIQPFLHPNAQKLMADLVACGVRTVVLDECHHLLDYWAIVLHYLINQMDTPQVIGLTATLPSAEDDRAYENYTSLLGDVDFEIPMPAVIKEGDLAPFRDLVYFVEPTNREMAYLNDVQRAFETAITELTAQVEFRRWVMNTVITQPFYEHNPLPWEKFLQKYPVFSLAGLRFLSYIGYPFPTELLLPQEAEEEIELDDWAVLLERYGLDVLKVSSAPEAHQQLQRLREILLPFGLTLTERGLRQGRSPGDLVLTFSEAKDAAVVEILTREADAMGDHLRAVVVTDFERMSSGVRSLDGILDRDAGSAVRVFYHLVHDTQTGLLDPILVTGRTVFVDADHGVGLLERFNTYLKTARLRATCHYEATETPEVLAVVGEGTDWSSRTYVRMITEAFEVGVTRCLVGTRGIFGEGWDSLALNTLIDLTSVTTSTSVQQLRGRTLRLDPAWEHKVAHNWDVICVAKAFEKGNVDLRRFLKRHDRYWGMVPLSTESPGMVSDDVTESQGRVVKGVNHVDPQLAYMLHLRNFRRIDFKLYTQRMLLQIPKRAQSYKLWGIGSEYNNSIYSAARLDTCDLKIRTVFSIQNTLLQMLRQFRTSALAGSVLILWFIIRISLGIGEGNSMLSATEEGLLSLNRMISVAMLVGIGVIGVINARQAYRLGKALLLEPPPESILLDVGRALLCALRDTDIVSRGLLPDQVRVVTQEDYSYDVLLENASPGDAATFIAAYRQIFELVRNQRYLILRDTSRLPNKSLNMVWSIVQEWFRNLNLYTPAYHPVPKVLATHKDRAEIFARYWRQYVGGGHLVYTRNEVGRQILLQARTQSRPKVKGLAFEIWR
ncbi:MAG: DEAD/DEAH box helicase family protein [Anaerolineae bacterium]|nr:DEAD/DEAH box helicase family protein [Anaerolineae bacterium]